MLLLWTIVHPWLRIIQYLYTNGTKKIAADIQEWSKIKIYVDINEMWDILKSIWLESSHAYYAYDVLKEGGVIYSFTHLVGGLFITGIWPCKAWKHDQRCENTGEGLRSYIQ